MCWYRLKDIENVDTDQGRHGYRSEGGYKSGAGYRSELYIYSMFIPIEHIRLE